MVQVPNDIALPRKIKIPVAAPKFLGNEVDYVIDCVYKKYFVIFNHIQQN